ncbi:hypothetical protein AKO1_007775 [Acrasis kona]|uniref:Large ribosomal subunit protein uL23m n=1 Tax=Acrasis kona TaxID=1008807 RepID=A0AAW2YR50_9EUKA
MMLSSLRRTLSLSSRFTIGNIRNTTITPLYVNKPIFVQRSVIPENIHRDYTVSMKRKKKKRKGATTPLFPRLSERRRRLFVGIARSKGHQDPQIWQKDVVKKRTVVTFPNRYMYLDIPSVLNKTRVVVFRTPHLEFTKPEIKGMLKSYYGLNIKKVNTAIYHGKKRKTRKGIMKVTKDYKKIYVHLNEEIDIKWPEDVKRYIARNRDKRLNKIYEMEEKVLEEEKEQAEKEAQAEANAPKEIPQLGN